MDEIYNEREAGISIRIPSVISSDQVKLSLWNEYFPAVFGEGEGFTKRDEVPFITFINLLAQQQDAIENIAMSGMYYESEEKGKILLKVHPAHKVFADSTRMLVPYYNRFGLSDYDRKTNEKRFPVKKQNKTNKFKDLE